MSSLRTGFQPGRQATHSPEYLELKKVTSKPLGVAVLPVVVVDYETVILLRRTVSVNHSPLTLLQFRNLQSRNLVIISKGEERHNIVQCTVKLVKKSFVLRFVVNHIMWREGYQF